MLSMRLAGFLGLRGIHYGWVMVAITFITMLATAAAIGIPGLLLVALRGEFAWSDAAVSGPLAVRLLMFGLMGPFAASLIQRHGVRATTGCALLCIVAGLAITMRATSLWELWIGYGLLVGLGTGATAVVLAAAVANRWFVARRGFVLGLLTASAATGQLLFLPAAAWLESYLSWRWAVVPAIVACGVAAILTWLLGANDPAQLGIRAYGEAEICFPPAPSLKSSGDCLIRVPSRPRGDGAVRLAFEALVEASGNRVFWMLFLTFFVCGLSTTWLVQVHLIPLCLDYGIGSIQAAGFLAVIGGFDFIGTIASGWLSDRFDNRWLLFWYFSTRALALLLLPLTGFSALGLGVFAVFYGLDWIATVPPTVKLTGAEFGPQKAGLVFGWIFAAHQLGAATAAYGAGLVRTLMVTYTPALFVAGAACLVAAGLVMLIRRPASPVKPATTKQPVAVAETLRA